MTRYFRPEQVEELRQISATIDARTQELVEAFIEHPFASAVAEEYAHHGYCRRLNTLSYCIDKIFNALPPDLEFLPTKEAREEATIHIQAFVFNVYGALDNLALLWVNERGIVAESGKPLSNMQIGLSASKTDVRKSLPLEILSNLIAFDDWFANLEYFRHALGHRIPLYIPPFCVRPDNIERYNDLDARRMEALRRHEFDEMDELTRQRDGLKFFRPWMMQSLNDLRPIVFHSQVLADFATVEDFGKKMLSALSD